MQKYKEVIKELRPGKSPGLDGFTSQYYKTFTQLLSKHLMSVYNNLAKHKHSSDSLLLAYIAVVPKPDKDPTDCANFRPISLLNVDLKNFTKILANRMKPLLSKIIGPEQVGKPEITPPKH